ncbi:thioredoxin domain-containing protein [Evansella sp. AB-P1]|uniref:thioredoxin domain-containing protein n=1 Tax=Evansella sp. AB-P1 TaxID=3037653 RepID=UPI00241CB827|nr:thioredoxin domain-containing protein [Evansella sp. AB-P1]MDG5786023.1 thioredoxin domain-containing protein [Evansella sp. AB-P1]
MNKLIVKQLSLLFALLLVITGCSDKNSEGQEEASNSLDTNVLGNDENLVYLGDEEADNEILFVLDYSCPWCKVWMDDVFPIIDENWIENGNAKFRTQTMVFLNENSLRLSDFDQNIKKHDPDNYFPVIIDIISEAGDDGPEGWGSEEYIKEKASKFNLSDELWRTKPERDSINITRRYTRALDIESVPAVFINGVKMEDPFDLELMKEHMIGLE